MPPAPEEAGGLSAAFLREWEAAITAANHRSAACRPAPLAVAWSCARARVCVRAHEHPVREASVCARASHEGSEYVCKSIPWGQPPRAPTASRHASTY